MIDPETIIFSCSSLDQFSAAFSSVFRALPPEMGNRLREILGNYFGWYGIEGAYQRMNNRSVAQIVAEYQPLDVKPVASGELEGLRYKLYDKPTPNSDHCDQEPSS
jgi:hypothetical protein